MAVRGCGTRVEGGIYAECGLSESGVPWYEFLFDPPRPIDPDDLGLSEIGVIPVQAADGTVHLMDWIGVTHYETPADFLEEVKRMGMSRRLPRNLDYSLLGPGSRMLLVHAKGYNRRFIDLYGKLHHAEQFPGHPWECPQDQENHAPRLNGAPQYPTEMCAGLWWEAVPANQSTSGGRAHLRRMPSFEYPAWSLPHDHQPDYQPALIASFPIARLAIIEAQDGSHASAAERAGLAELPVNIEVE